MILLGNREKNKRKSVCQLSEQNIWVLAPLITKGIAGHQGVVCNHPVTVSNANGATAADGLRLALGLCLGSVGAFSPSRAHCARLDGNVHPLLHQESKELGSVLLLLCLYMYSPSDIIKNLITGIQEGKDILDNILHRLGASVRLFPIKLLADFRGVEVCKKRVGSDFY